ncbi:hypothetical protein OIN60_06130 [Paenibacillus sp. P96]|uniref:Peptidase C39-like domain-containing protein n=1 Tax=Paenibacillus zeirhizosphaerae TaxID=2987519 RepID=A0ABT9FNP2_9BACL|nr:hypothetical protein [Paenibacillus sp. P96]MDP4096345.1 hypothetical protein [Paenibacillus sp. P96]
MNRKWKWITGVGLQRQIVKYVKGAVVDEPGTNNETIEALNYGGVEGTHKNNILAFDTVVAQINKNQPVLAAINWNNSTDGVGHMYVIHSR